MRRIVASASVQRPATRCNTPANLRGSQPASEGHPDSWKWSAPVQVDDQACSARTPPRQRWQMLRSNRVSGSRSLPGGCLGKAHRFSVLSRNLDSPQHPAYGQRYRPDAYRRRFFQAALLRSAGYLLAPTSLHARETSRGSPPWHSSTSGQKGLTAQCLSRETSESFLAQSAYALASPSKDCSVSRTTKGSHDGLVRDNLCASPRQLRGARPARRLTRAAPSAPTAPAGNAARAPAPQTRTRTPSPPARSAPPAGSPGRPRASSPPRTRA